jgi:hypothetical protein
MAQLDNARVALNSHRDNVQLLEGEISRIRHEIQKLKSEYENTGDPEVKARIAWAVNDLQRHQIRLADEQAAVMEWSEVVESLMHQIAIIEEGEAGELDQLK